VADITPAQVARYAQIAEERSVLAQMELQGATTRAQAARLRYLDRQMDQLEETIIGDRLDVLESAIAAREGLARDMQEFIGKLKEARRRADLQINKESDHE